MLLRNLNQSTGLYNGTPLIVTQLGKWHVQGKILKGTNKGDLVFIPRIIMTPTDAKLPFKLKLRQLLLAICFAMMINKSQGQSFKKVGPDLLKQVFSHEQLYVSLSRVTSRDSLCILNTNEKK